jgi:hypothetical protein
MDAMSHDPKPNQVLVAVSCQCQAISFFWVCVGWKVWHFDAKSDPNLLLFTVMKTHLLLLNL